MFSAVEIIVTLWSFHHLFTNQCVNAQPIHKLLSARTAVKMYYIQFQCQACICGGFIFRWVKWQCFGRDLRPVIIVKCNQKRKKLPMCPTTSHFFFYIICITIKNNYTQINLLLCSRNVHKNIFFKFMNNLIIKFINLIDYSWLITIHD